MEPLIYLDNNATTAVDPGVLEKMLPFFNQEYANASSTVHRAGKQAAAAVDQARKELAGLLNARESEFYFTSGSTEAINWALKGAYQRFREFRRHIITLQTEHKAVLDTCRYLEKQGAEVTYLPVQENGQVDPQELRSALKETTFLAAIMYANNETGVIQPVNEIAEVLKDHPALWFCDATQAVGKLPLDLSELPVDMLALSAHKFYGPKGAGALYIRKAARSTPVEPLLHGGGQQQGLRAGTLNVPGIVGLGEAARIAKMQMQTDAARIRPMRDALQDRLGALPGTLVQGSGVPRLYNTLNITFRFVRAEELIVSLPALALSAGSACTTGSLDPSHVLIAMGLSPEDARATLRISLGRFNTAESVQSAADALIAQVGRLRAGSPLWSMYRDGHIT